jgi:hypothetical protein
LAGGDDPVDLAFEPGRVLGGGEADVEADHGDVRHHVQRRAAVDLGDVAGHAVALPVQGVQGLGDPRGLHHRVAAGGEVAAGVGGLAVDDDVEIARALAGAGQGAVGQGRLVGQAHVPKARELGQDRGRGDRADLLVRRQQHAIADLRASGWRSNASSAASITEIPPFMSAMPGPCRAPSGRVVTVWKPEVSG